MKKLAWFIGFWAPLLLSAQQAPGIFKNPILPGFHPDPSICRVGDDYYLVNSSFEWFPGVPVYQSRDLVNWKQLGNVLDRPEQLKMLPGMAHNRGIWAPTIRYHEGLFYMVTTCQDCGGNFFVTATDPAGPWTDPVWIKDAPGIDPSMFWDDDGSCWYTGASGAKTPRWPNENRIYIAKLDVKTGNLLTKKTEITSGHASNARWTEGPHLFKINGRYMLMVAEGGTELEHSITVFESDSIMKTYIPSYRNPVLTHRHLGNNYPITTIGHGDLVQTQNGDWWSVMLGKRQQGGYFLSRETFLTPVKFENGWPVFNPTVGKVLAEDRRPDLPWTPVPNPYVRDEFNGDKLGNEYCCLRTHMSKWWSVQNSQLIIDLKSDKYLELGNPAFWGRRIEHFDFEAATCVILKSKKENEEAGLLAYRTNEYHYTLMKNSKYISLIHVRKNQTTGEVTRIPYSGDTVVLKVQCKDNKFQFFFGSTENELIPIGMPQDATTLSDGVSFGFNGPFVGVGATSNGKESKSKACFDWFEYKGVE